MKITKEILVAFCTYKRENRIENLINQLIQQETKNEFSISIRIVDNDKQRSAEKKVEKIAEKNKNIKIEYLIEEEQNISLARNKTIQNINDEYDFIAFIDDDEVPMNNMWLWNMYHTLNKFNSDGLLGPTEPIFEINPPKWIKDGKFYERIRYETGTKLTWKQMKTGNNFIARSVLKDEEAFFKKEFGSGGEDKDFFKRLIQKGYTFIWCNEAVVGEYIPQERTKPLFMLKRGLLRGQVASINLKVSDLSFIKSIGALTLYFLIIPFLMFYKRYLFMKLLIKICDHLGKVLGVLGIEIIKEKYVLE